MDMCIILNPHAGSAEEAETLRDAIAADSTMTLWETTPESSARKLAASALGVWAQCRGGWLYRPDE